MKIEIITLFPGYFDSVLRESIIGKGLEKKLFEIDIINLRDFTSDKHQTADDKPFGGGGGMVLKVEPIARCLESLGYGSEPEENARIILTSAAGATFSQEKAVRLSIFKRLTIICGHYLGVDERLLAIFDIDEVSIGDYVLTGGEPAAAVILDSVTRLIPGVLGNFESAMDDSHTDKMLGTPVYTRPEEFRGQYVPKVLLEGNHKEIENYRKLAAIGKTFKNRPELLDKIELDKDEKDYIDKIKMDENND
jgi:tRNA (guanine37-N1)-methyltransferase